MTQNFWKPMIKFSRNSYLLDMLNKLIPQVVDTPSLRPGQVHHLPHHPVIIIDKETTKVRAAFDTSTKIKGNPSLHDC